MLVSVSGCSAPSTLFACIESLLVQFFSFVVQTLVHKHSTEPIECGKRFNVIFSILRSAICRQLPECLFRRRICPNLEEFRLVPLTRAVSLCIYRPTEPYKEKAPVQRCPHPLLGIDTLSMWWPNHLLTTAERQGLVGLRGLGG
jgi:hypothetical protein